MRTGLRVSLAQTEQVRLQELKIAYHFAELPERAHKEQRISGVSIPLGRQRVHVVQSSNFKPSETYVSFRL